jgi:3-dehydroquinate dehydratase/shikimate dehydrogenase
MICISIAQESRRLALADMLNASRQCDLLEIQLDRFDRAPDIKELLENKPKPVILSCRRPQDGGQWKGTETERLALLRQCIIDKADYVEIELDVADDIRRLPPAKRVISYTNLRETPADIAEIYAEAQRKGADVIKLVTLARTPEEAWPLVQILAKPAIPTVVVGLGKPGVMLSVLGRKIGAPWVYAALERGMEAYPGQATVRDLNEVYAYPTMTKSTPLVAVTGFTPREYALIGALNAGFAEAGAAPRCLPAQIGSVKLFRKVMDVIRFKGVVVDDAHQGDILEVVSECEPAAKQAHAADVIASEEKVFHGYNTLWRAAGSTLEAVLREKRGGDKPLHDRIVMIVGVNAMARSITLGVKQRGAIPVIASYDKNASQKLAHDLGCRHIPFEALYTTRHDVLAVCAVEQGLTKESGVQASYLKPSITVMDLTELPKKSPLLIEAQRRGCEIVPPRRLLLEQAMQILRLMTEKEVSREKIEAVLAELAPDEE